MNNKFLQILALIPLGLIGLLFSKKMKKNDNIDSATAVDDYSMYPVGTNKDLPRGIRNFNPGNIRINPVNNWQGVIDRSKNTDGAFEQFKTMEFGVRALFRLLETYLRKSPNMTLRQLILKYAPEKENNSEAYMQAVASSIGQDIDGEVSQWFSDGVSKKQLVRAIIKHENGRHIANKHIDEGFILAYS
ncbi:hypothetical protein C7447_102248 [Tenacibaculum adriaticum]|uniref:Uncharacterized protein n=1 Tax=Tenacibaculum adriaticum TaxID=413713 RepID=A0A5S5DSM2_9FLAO|nr:hypothetical protein [Tenacibaculum adriaticum]TYP98930.1 hypothetical protein C7447_102248 [Tenacibaculum adriaticum]